MQGAVRWKFTIRMAFPFAVDCLLCATTTTAYSDPPLEIWENRNLTFGQTAPNEFHSFWPVKGFRSERNSHPQLGNAWLPTGQALWFPRLSIFGFGLGFFTPKLQPSPQLSLTAKAAAAAAAAAKAPSATGAAKTQKYGKICWQRPLSTLPTSSRCCHDPWPCYPETIPGQNQPPIHHEDSPAICQRGRHANDHTRQKIYYILLKSQRICGALKYIDKEITDWLLAYIGSKLKACQKRSS